MLKDITLQPKRTARVFQLDDQATVTAVDRPPFEQYEEYPLWKRNIIRLPLPFKTHRKRLQREKETKSAHENERLLQEFDEKDGKLVATPDAILAIHVLEMENVSVRVTNFDKSAPMFFYLLISVGKKRKMTKVSLTHDPERVRVDATVYFSIEVSNVRENYRNKLKFELWAFQEPATHFIIGTKEIHIYQLIQAVHSIEYLQIWSEGFHAATIVYEFAFAYGLFGFGHSNQLRNTKSTIYKAIQNSMFPRIRLADEDLIDNKFNVRVPKKIHLIGMSNFLLYAPQKVDKPNSSLHIDDPIQPKLFSLQHVEFDRGQPIFAKVNIKIEQEEFEADFNETYGEYLCVGSRRERLEYLRELVYGRLEDIQEQEVGALWEALDDQTAEDIIRSEDNPQILVHPSTSPCKDYPLAFIEPGDEPFLQTFPVLSRSSGWLGRLFGFSPIEDDPHYDEPTYPYEHVRGYSKHRLTGWQVATHGLKYVWSKITGLVTRFLVFVFPDLDVELTIPEIALTLPSRQGSTTDLYVSWVTDEREHYEYATASHHIQDPVHDAYEAVNKLLYEEYDKDTHFARESESKNPVENLALVKRGLSKKGVKHTKHRESRKSTKKS